jgi:hypothetical protein
LEKDTGHGYRTVNQIRHALGLSKPACRTLLDELTAEGRILRIDFANAVVWKCTIPLPWQPGGALTIPKVYTPFVSETPTFILQREVERSWVDVKTFDDEERARGWMEMERNNASQRARDSEVCRWPPRYRLVVSVERRIAEELAQ